VDVPVGGDALAAVGRWRVPGGEVLEMSKPVVQLLLVDGRPAIKGELDLSAVAELDAWLASLGDGPISVDLSGVTFLDSSGLRSLLNARRRNPGLRVVDPSAVVTRLLEITSTRAYLVDGADAPTEG
jgi:anti-anti-sigma factor